jgi:hypothetical protein
MIRRAGRCPRQPYFDAASGAVASYIALLYQHGRRPQTALA